MFVSRFLKVVDIILRGELLCIVFRECLAI